MKLALLLFGISKKDEYVHWRNNKKYFIDYEKSYENYKEYIFDYFKSIGYDIDVYFTSNMLDDENKKKLCEKYKPVKYNFIENHKNHTISRNTKLINVMDLCLNSGIDYDLILITRFDLKFQKKFGESNINLDKFNLVILERKNICDNFYLFPYKYFKTFQRFRKVCQ